ncbi:MAG: hypothetical protein KatS3mg102_2983 [Planctomycetota bacterium]|nr:MAG: hypothetical protein KatS3mg102_2983 [Planctomycetota bacterium]
MRSRPRGGQRWEFGVAARRSAAAASRTRRTRAGPPALWLAALALLGCGGPARRGEAPAPATPQPAARGERTGAGRAEAEAAGGVASAGETSGFGLGTEPGPREPGRYRVVFGLCGTEWWVIEAPPLASLPALPGSPVPAPPPLLPPPPEPPRSPSHLALPPPR